ncbi:hypothetical protein DFH28DRAFT_30565 [Melampsora americana]|nr:hypothetical protein DFH28DRAFT_30565 [Melampsora americana]
MLIPTTFILLVLVTAQIVVCAPIEDVVKSEKVLITSDGGLLATSTEKGKAVSGITGGGVPTRIGGCKAGCCSHPKPKPQKGSSSKIEEIQVKSSLTRDPISSKEIMGKQGDVWSFKSKLLSCFDLIGFFLIER